MTTSNIQESISEDMHETGLHSGKSLKSSWR